MGTEPLLIVLAEDDDGHASLVQRNLERAGLANGLEGAGLPTGSGWSVEEPTSRLPRSDDWFQGVAHLVDCVLHDTEPVPSATHARHVLDIMLTALRSAQEGQALALQTTFQLPMATP